MAIVGESCNADAHAKIPALFMSMLCPRLRNNMSSAVCVVSMYSRLYLKMLFFLFMLAWAILRVLYLSCEIPFRVWIPDNISVSTTYFLFVDILSTAYFLFVDTVSTNILFLQGN